MFERDIDDIIVNQLFLDVPETQHKNVLKVEIPDIYHFWQ